MEKLQAQVDDFAKRALIERCGEPRKEINLLVLDFADMIVETTYPDADPELAENMAFDLFHNSMYAPVR